jgi:hypothetical protein
MVSAASSKLSSIPLRIAHSAQPTFSDTIDRLATAALPQLRAEWTRWHPNIPLPKGLPRDLLVRSIIWELQAREHGGLSASVTRELGRLIAQLATSGDLNLEREVRLKPGTRLVREWRGRTYRVEVLRDGYVMDERRYASLSHVARAITGTRWSGPRFFGLKHRERTVRRSLVNV